MQALRPGLLVLRVGLVPLRDPGVEIPAVVIEPGLLGERLELGGRLLVQLCKSDHHVCDLYAGIVDIVLNVHFPSRVAQQAHERVAQHGVAKVSDVRGFVGIDAGVLDQNLAGWNFARLFTIRGQGRSHPGAVHFHVQVARRRNGHPRDALNFSDLGPNGFGNFQGSRA